eukprot:gene15067-biopygen11773
MFEAPPMGQKPTVFRCMFSVRGSDGAGADTSVLRWPSRVGSTLCCSDQDIPWRRFGGDFAAIWRRGGGKHEFGLELLWRRFGGDLAAIWRRFSNDLAAQVVGLRAVRRRRLLGNFLKISSDPCHSDEFPRKFPRKSPAQKSSQHYFWDEVEPVEADEVGPPARAAGGQGGPAGAGADAGAAQQRVSIPRVLLRGFLGGFSGGSLGTALSALAIRARAAGHHGPAGPFQGKRKVPTSGASPVFLRGFSGGSERLSQVEGSSAGADGSPPSCSGAHATILASQPAAGGGIDMSEGFSNAGAAGVADEQAEGAGGGEADADQPRRAPTLVASPAGAAAARAHPGDLGSG